MTHDRKLPTTLEMAGYALLFILVLIGFSFLFIEPGRRVGFVIFAVFVTSLGVANAFSPGVKMAFLKFFGAYLLFTIGLLVVLGLLLAFRFLSDVLVAGTSALPRVLVLTTWGALLVSASFVVVYGKTRELLFGRLEKTGVLLPLAYSLTLLMISIQFFAVATFLFHRAGSVSLALGSASALTSDAVADFFLWHFLNAIPILKVTDTLLWDAPLTYKASSVGWIILAFKISVIIPVIAAFTWSWKRFKTEATPQTQ
ncbi:MAG: hypothetical protein ACYSUI_13875 [Planctomycetota bacterium]|jgi:hypothetical protein